MFEEMTYDVIMQRMLDRIPDDMDKREGSIIWDALSPAALELELAYICLDYTLIESFADTCDREYLIRRCAERGITPTEATCAVIKGEFTPATLDLTGQRFNLGKLNYVAEEAIEGEAGAWKLKCETAGTAGNTIYGDLVPVDYIDGLTSAEATAILIPGEDEEGTEALRQRYFDSFDAKGFGGNVQSYLDAANALDGVGATKVVPTWNGGGTVKLIIIGSDYGAASSTLVNSVQAAFDPSGSAGNGAGLAPIGHTVTVVSAGETDVAITTVLEFASGYSWSNLQSSIEAAMEDYMLSLRKEWADNDTTIVRISQIDTRLLAIEGINDVTGTKINGSASNLTVASANIPILESVGDGSL